MVVHSVTAKGYGSIRNTAICTTDAIGKVHGGIRRTVELEFWMVGDPEIARTSVNEKVEV